MNPFCKKPMSRNFNFLLYSLPVCCQNLTPEKWRESCFCLMSCVYHFNLPLKPSSTTQYALHLMRLVDLFNSRILTRSLQFLACWRTAILLYIWSFIISTRDEYIYWKTVPTINEYQIRKGSMIVNKLLRKWTIK